MKKLLGLSLSMALLALAVSPAMAETINANAVVSYTTQAESIDSAPATLADFAFVANSTADETSTKAFSDSGLITFSGDEAMSIAYKIGNLSDTDASSADKTINSKAVREAANAPQTDTYTFTLATVANTINAANANTTTGCAVVKADISVSDVAQGLTATNKDMIVVSGFTGALKCAYDGTITLGDATLKAQNFASDGLILAETKTNPTSVMTITLLQ